MALPNDVDLIYLDAVLHQRNGLNQDAAKLAQLGAAKTSDPMAKRRFISLMGSLPKS